MLVFLQGLFNLDKWRLKLTTENKNRVIMKFITQYILDQTKFLENLVTVLKFRH